MKVEGADPPDLDADLDPDEEEDGVILLGVQELPCWRDMVAASGGGIPRGGEFLGASVSLADKLGPPNAREVSSVFPALSFYPESPSASRGAGDGLGSPGG
ncbi:hypothetical protein QYE76_044128 [Lolium multiflorum]|uniref:Uncharacterized protein n=1 Tax=Lolium multiflorum TaxID=4521 RepID=A0AAD8WWG3_LOLMU|nr:hypothetical protein QYE76_044128 [Lolium multiflorum]